jgi:hypothetical protein
MQQALDHKQLVARVLSVSFMAQLPPAEQETVAREVLAVAEEHGEPVVLHHVTETYWCEAA